MPLRAPVVGRWLMGVAAVMMAGIPAHAATVAAGATHTAVVTPDQTVWVWGANGNGQLGLGNTTAKGVPTQVPSLGGVVAVAAGAAHTLALTSGGLVYAWVANAHQPPLVRMHWRGYGAHATTVARVYPADQPRTRDRTGFTWRGRDRSRVSSTPSPCMLSTSFQRERARLIDLRGGCSSQSRRSDDSVYMADLRGIPDVSAYCRILR